MLTKIIKKIIANQTDNEVVRLIKKSDICQCDGVVIEKIKCDTNIEVKTKELTKYFPVNPLSELKKELFLESNKDAISVKLPKRTNAIIEIHLSRFAKDNKRFIFG